MYRTTDLAQHGRPGEGTAIAAHRDGEGVPLPGSAFGGDHRHRFGRLGFGYDFARLHRRRTGCAQAGHRRWYCPPAAIGGR
jgi:hypothetical protein